MWGFRLEDEGEEMEDSTAEESYDPKAEVDEVGHVLAVIAACLACQLICSLIISVRRP